MRYKQAFLGVAWAILQPLTLTLVFTIFFSKIAHVPSDGIPYPVFSFTGLLPWTFIATSISFGTLSLVSNMNLVTKVNIPREILPIASVGASLVDFFTSAIVFIGMLIYFKIQFTIALLWLPYFLIIQIILATGLALFFSTLNVFFRDIRFAVPLFIQLWLYASPVIYPTSSVPEQFRTVYMLNPAACLIESYRSVVLHGESPTLLMLSIMTVISVAILIFGYVIFKKNDSKFADVI